MVRAAANAVLKQHWPDAAIYEDVTTVDCGSVPPVDVLTRGFPARTSAMLELESELASGGAVMASGNITSEPLAYCDPGSSSLRTWQHLIRRRLATILCDLATVRYDAEWHCRPASAVGAPRCRDRIFILAYPRCGGGERPESPETSLARGALLKLKGCRSG
jgi:DNA (cytosine-5)-methyltransferase 1